MPPDWLNQRVPDWWKQRVQEAITEAETHTKQLNDVLNFWHIGYSGGQIAKETGLSKRRVYRIVQSAQERGDERAAAHRVSMEQQHE